MRRQVDWTRLYPGHRDRMRVAIFVARQNVERKTGGPFGAAVFDDASGRIIAVGANRAASDGSFLLHAETIALALAAQRLGRHGHDRALMASLELHSSCEPCIMCAGAVLMCGVPRIVSAATVNDAAAVGIEGGAVPAAVWDLLRQRGIDHTPGVLRDEAREVLALWRAAARRRGS